MKSYPLNISIIKVEDRKIKYLQQCTENMRKSRKEMLRQNLAYLVKRWTAVAKVPQVHVRWDAKFMTAPFPAVGQYVHVRSENTHFEFNVDSLSNFNLPALLESGESR